MDGSHKKSLRAAEQRNLVKIFNQYQLWEVSSLLIMDYNYKMNLESFN